MIGASSCPVAYGSFKPKQSLFFQLSRYLDILSRSAVLQSSGYSSCRQRLCIMAPAKRVPAPSSLDVPVDVDGASSVFAQALKGKPGLKAKPSTKSAKSVKSYRTAKSFPRTVSIASDDDDDLPRSPNTAAPSMWGRSTVNDPVAVDLDSLALNDACRSSVSSSWTADLRT